MSGSQQGWRSVGGNTPATNYGLYSQIANSIPVTATINEGSLIGEGIGNLSVPSNGFKVGDSFSLKTYGVLSCVANATIQIKLKFNSVILADLGVITLSTRDALIDVYWAIDCNYTIRELGIAGVGSVLLGGVFSYKTDSGEVFKMENFSNENNTTFETTIANTFDVTAQWNTNNAGNSINSELFILNKIY